MRNTRTAVLDTNVLLLLLVAMIDASLLRTFKRVSQFTTRDIDTLNDLCQSFLELATTPHVLSETDNFIDQAPVHRRNDLRAALARFIDNSPERYRPAKDLVTLSEFQTLGLTDSGLMEFAGDAFVVTTDFALSGKIQAAGGHVVNFREYAATSL